MPHGSFVLFRTGSFSDDFADEILTVEEEIMFNVQEAHNHIPAGKKRGSKEEFKAQIKAFKAKAAKSELEVEEGEEEEEEPGKGISDASLGSSVVTGGMKVELISSAGHEVVENQRVATAGSGRGDDDGELDDDDEMALLAERKARRKADRHRRREEHREKKRQAKKAAAAAAEKANGKALEELSNRRRVIKDIGADEEDGPLLGPAPVPANEVLLRSFATVNPPGLGPEHKPMQGVWSMERAFRHDLGSDPSLLLSLEPKLAAAAKARSKAVAEEAAALVGGSSLPEWVSTHPDFVTCVAKPLDGSSDGGTARAKQLRLAMRVPPQQRPLSSVLMLAQWLVQYTDLPLDGVPQRNLMILARHMSMRRLKRRGKSVYECGQPPTHVYVVMEGFARQDAHMPTESKHAATSTPNNKNSGKVAAVAQRKGAATAAGGGGVVPPNSLGLPALSPVDAAATDVFTAYNGGDDNGLKRAQDVEAQEAQEEEDREGGLLVAPEGFELSGVGATLGPGRSFGLVSSMAFAEPRSESVYNGVCPWEVAAEQAEQEHARFVRDEKTSKKSPNSCIALLSSLLTVIEL